LAYKYFTPTLTQPNLNKMQPSSVCFFIRHIFHLWWGMCALLDHKFKCTAYSLVILHWNWNISSSTDFPCPSSPLVKMYPAAPVPQHSNLRLIAKVTPDYAITKITWTAPGSIPMKSEKKTNSGTVAKLPQVQNSDGGVYICTVYPWGNSTSVFATNMEVTVDGETDSRRKYTEALRNRIDLLLPLLMIWAAIKARNSAAALSI